VLKPSEIFTIWRRETPHALRSGRVVVLLILFLLFVALALFVVGFFNHQMNAQFETQVAKAGGDLVAAREQLLSTKKQFLSGFVTDDEAMLDSLSALPLVLLVVFKLTIRFVPLFIALMGFDQISGDVAPKSIRYFLLRARRSSYVVGKFLAQATVFALVLTIGTALMVLTAKLLNADFSLTDAVLWGLRLLGGSIVLSLAYLALTSLCSALVKQGPVSLVLNNIALFVFWFIALVGEMYRLPGEVVAEQSLALFRTESPLAYLRYASVWFYGQDLLHPHPARFLSAAAVHLAFAGAFLALAHVALRRRDL
jgi:ABC-type transport system involved in multi-copper enzyme maturation permease subunit